MYFDLCRKGYSRELTFIEERSSKGATAAPIVGAASALGPRSRAAARRDLVICISMRYMCRRYYSSVFRRLLNWSLVYEYDCDTDDMDRKGNGMKGGTRSVSYTRYETGNLRTEGKEEFSPFIRNTSSRAKIKFTIDDTISCPYSRPT